MERLELKASRCISFSMIARRPVTPLRRSVEPGLTRIDGYFILDINNYNILTSILSYSPSWKYVEWQ